MNQRFQTLAVALAAALTLSLQGCVTANPDVIRNEDLQRMSTVQDATVLSVRQVVTEGSQSGAGVVVGSMVGSIAGSNVGGYRDGFIGSIIGAVAGAVVGNAVEQSASREAAVELTLQLRNGDKRMIIQGQGSEVFRPGDAVTVISNGYRARVVRASAPSSAAPMPPTAPVSSAPAAPAATSGVPDRPTPVYTPR